MRRSLIIITLIFSTTFSIANATDSKLKAVGIMAVYGTVGGALLGTATLAFDGSSRNIAKGASLGLYAGLLFGGYVILSHSLRNYDWRTSPGEPSYTPEGTGGDGSYEREQRYRANLDEVSAFRDSSMLSKPKNRPNLFYFNLFNKQF